MNKRIYNGLHLHHALACLNAGNEHGAISWIWKDISEISNENEMPVSGTIKKEINGYISYYSVCDQCSGINGDGI